MKRIALAIAVLLAATVANAEIYQWKDKNGKIVYSDTPPVGNVSDQKTISSDSANSTTAQKTAADREMEFRKRQKASQENSEKTQKDQASTVEKQENCANARRYLATLESGERVALRDDKGERYFMDDAQRVQETAKAKQALQTNCQ